MQYNTWYLSKSSTTCENFSPATVMTSPTINNDTESDHPLVVVNLTGILKLNSSNYLSWKLQLQAILYGYGLFKVLDGTHPKPSPLITTPTTSTTTIAIEKRNPQCTT